MRRGRSPRARTIAPILAALLVVALGLRRGKDDLSTPRSPVARVDEPAPARPAESTRAAEHRVSPSASPTTGAAPSVAEAATTPPVFDFATLADRGAPAPSGDGDRFRTSEKFTVEDLAHPERYFEAAEQLPELRRDEERHDALEFFLAYRARLEHDLGVARRDPVKRAAVLAVIERYDAAIARMRSSLATPTP